MADSWETVQWTLSPQVPRSPGPQARTSRQRWPPPQKGVPGHPCRHAGLFPWPDPHTQQRAPLWAASARSPSEPGRPLPSCPHRLRALNGIPPPGGAAWCQPEVPGPAPDAGSSPGARANGLGFGDCAGSSSGTVCFVKWGALPPGAPCLGLTACPLVRRPSMPAPFSSGLGSRQEVPGVHLSCSPA